MDIEPTQIARRTQSDRSRRGRRHPEPVHLVWPPRAARRRPERTMELFTLWLPLFESIEWLALSLCALDSILAF